MAWTEEKTTELKKLWAEGHTASQIAKELGGVTRNAVIGKSHRLNLQGRAQSRMISSPKVNNRTFDNSEGSEKRTRRPRGLRAIVIEQDFEPENPKQLEELTKVLVNGLLDILRKKILFLWKIIYGKQSLLQIACDARLSA